jgi:hypothetical protein
MESVFFSELSLVQNPSGRRDPAKFDWRGYLPSGAVKAEEADTNLREFQGLPVLDRLSAIIRKAPEGSDTASPARQWSFGPPAIAQPCSSNEPLCKTGALRVTTIAHLLPIDLPL